MINYIVSPRSKVIVKLSCDKSFLPSFFTKKLVGAGNARGTHTGQRVINYTILPRRKVSAKGVKFFAQAFLQKSLAPSADGEILCVQRAQEGRINSPVDCLSVGNPRRGFPD